eukprot:12885897-Prorocentrum_lima.AAC.1
MVGKDLLIPAVAGGRSRYNDLLALPSSGLGFVKRQGKAGVHTMCTPPSAGRGNNGGGGDAARNHRGA